MLNPNRQYWHSTVLIRAILIVLTCFCFLSAKQTAAETIKFKIISHISKLEILPIEDTDGHMIGIYKRTGLALFEDGKVATVESQSTFDGIKGKGTFQGYSMLTHEDGSTTVSKHTGSMWRIQDGKFRLEKGRGEYIKGTGKFRGIKGTSSWTGRRYTPYVKGIGADNLIDVTAIYTLPSE